MIQKNPYAAYNNSKIQTATPAELTLLLYEGAIKFTNIAIVAIEKGDIEKAHNNIRKAENIIREFQITLDHKYAVAKDFDAVYTYLLQRLLEANMKKDKGILEEVLGHLRTMRDTWKEVMAKTANGNNMEVVVVDYWKRIPKDSFQKWYDSQSRYRTKEDREKDAIVEEATITMPEMARLLGLTRSQVYQILRNPKYSHFFETIVIAEKKRITKENFQKFLEGQNQFHLDPANDYEELALGILHLMKHHIWQKSAEA